MGVKNKKRYILALVCRKAKSERVRKKLVSERLQDDGCKQAYRSRIEELLSEERVRI